MDDIRGDRTVVTRELTEDEKDLPIRAIWPLARLKLLLRAGWIPRYETVAGDTTFTGDGETPPRNYNPGLRSPLA